MAFPFVALLETILTEPACKHALAIIAHDPMGDLDWRSNLPLSYTIERVAAKSFLESLESITRVHQPQCIFVFPPLGLDLPATRLSKGQSPSRLGLACLECIVDQSADGVTVAALLPQSALSSTRASSSRATLFNRAAPQFVLEFDHARDIIGLKVDSRVWLSFLVLRVGSAPDVIRFFRIPPLAQHVSNAIVHDELRRLLVQGGGQTTNGYVLRSGFDASRPLTFDRYHPDIAQAKKDLGYLGSVRPLTDVASVHVGISRALLLDSQQLSSSDFLSRVISGRDITADGEIELSRPRPVPQSVTALVAGDICVRTITDPLNRLRAAEITETALPAIPDNTVVVVRPHRMATLAERRLLLAYLRSLTARRFLAAESPGFHISASAISQLPVPVPDAELSSAISSLDAAASDFKNWANGAQAALDVLFENKSTSDSRLSVLETGRLVRQRREAASLVEDFRNRIRVRMPHPIAYRWRELEASAPDSDGYLRILDCAEASTCYVAQLAIISVRAIGVPPLKWITEMSKRFVKTHHGTSFGDWIAILREIGGADAIKQRRDLPFYEITTLLTNKNVDGALQRLKTARDDHAHGRGPRAYEIKAHFERAYEDLVSLMRAIDFLSDYPLRFIEGARLDTIEKQTQYTYRDLMGDHPFVPIQTGITDASDLETSSLYVVDRAGHLHLLRPLLTRQQCAQCGNWSTFVLDRYDRVADRTSLKSLEHNHTVWDAGISKAFRSVGMFPVDASR